MGGSSDVVVVGAGVFGAWTAYQLRRSGRSPWWTRTDRGTREPARAASRGSSGSATATRRSTPAGHFGPSSSGRHCFAKRTEALFVKSGVLWLGRHDDALIDATTLTLQRLGVRVELLARDDLAARFPQFHLGSIARGVLEPESGVILARHVVQTVVTQAVYRGVQFSLDAVAPPDGRDPRLTALRTGAGDRLIAEAFVFACGAWLPELFPQLVAPHIHTTRQEAFFFGAAPGARQFAPAAMPAWVDSHDRIHGLPDLDGRGFKVGLDQHGPSLDPDTGQRLPSPGALLTARQLATKRLPTLRDAQLLDARVCQYANTWNGDFLIDRHPDFENVWLVGGGSGHGFKHGPAVGEYVTGLLTGTGKTESRFTLAAKQTQRKRGIYEGPRSGGWGRQREPVG